MLQPDVFFSYGLASGLSIAAGKKLKKEESPFANRYFSAAMVWLSVLYVPQVLYLLFKFPAWESMFVLKSLSDMPAWFMSLYIALVMVMGVLGFYVTYVFIRKGKMTAALAQVGWSFTVATVLVTVGWDGTGYKRLLYAGTAADWMNGVAYPLTAFLTGPVLPTLLWLEALVLVPYAILFIKWTREAGRA